MSKSEDEKELERLANLISKQFEDKFAAYSEHAEEQNQTWQRQLDVLIDGKLAPLQSGLKELKGHAEITTAAIKDSNREIRQLDKAVGNVEHKVHNINVLVTSNFLNDSKTLRKLQTRVERLEAA